MAIPGIAGYNAYSRGLASSDCLTFRRGVSSGESDNMGSILGVNDSSLLSDFNNHIFSLVEGRHILSEDKKVLMISETLAMENNLTIGDTVELRPAEVGVNEAYMFINIMDDSGPGIPAKIIGIFAENEVQIGAFIRPAAGIVANQLFADHSIMTSLGLANQGQYEAVTFHVQDPSELPRIIYELGQIEDMGWEYFLIQHSDGDYTRISGDLQTVQNLIMILLIAIGIVSTIILTLIVILRMRGRIHEVGILLSVGISKKQIWRVFLLEIAIIAMLSFAVSYATASLAVPALSQGLFAGLPALSELGQHEFQPMPLAAYSPVYLLILLIILSTAYITTSMTIRLKPKQILTKMS